MSACAGLRPVWTVEEKIDLSIRLVEAQYDRRPECAFVSSTLCHGGRGGRLLAILVWKKCEQARKEVV